MSENMEMLGRRGVILIRHIFGRVCRLVLKAPTSLVKTGVKRKVFDRTIEGVVVNIPAVEPGGGPHKLNISATAGSDITVHVDWCSTNPAEVWVADAALLPEQVIEHTIDPSVVGECDVEVTLSNAQSHIVVTAAAHIDNRLADVSCEHLDAGIGEPVSFSCTATAGTRITLFIRYGDTYLEAATYTDYTLLPDGGANGYFVYSGYPSDGPANFSSEIVLGNSHEEFEFPREVQIIERLTGMALAYDDTILGSTTTFTFTRTAGSHLNCTYDYGDTNTDNEFFYEMDMTYSVTHDYASAGAFSIDFTCINNLAESFTEASTIYIEEVVADLAADSDELDVILGNDATFSFSMSSGTHCIAALVDENPDTVPADIVKTHTDGELSGSFTLTSPSLGFHKLTLTVSNHVSSEDIFIYVRVDIPIPSVNLISPQTYYVPTTDVTFEVGIPDGSYPLYFLDFVDDFYHLRHVESLGGPDSYSTTHAWTDPGYYDVLVTASNNVSEVQKIFPIGIEYDLCPGMTITAIGTPSNHISLPLEFVISQSGCPAPTSVVAKVDLYGNLTVQQELPAPIADDADFHVPVMYELYGLFNPNITLCNNISCQSVVTSVQIGVNISNPSCSIVTKPIFVGGEVTFSFHTDAGSNVTYTAQPGTADIVDENWNPSIVAEHTQAHDTNLVYHYTSPGRYTTTCIVENQLGRFESIEDVIAYSNVTGSECHPAKYYVAVGEVLSYEAGILEGTLAAFSVDHGDGNINQEDHPEFDSATHTLTFTHSFAQAGNYTQKCTFNNSVNTEEITLENPVVVQDVILSLTVTDNSPVMFPAGTATYTLTTGEYPTDVFCTFDFNTGTAQQVVFVESLTTLQTQSVDYTFTEDMVGPISVAVNCSNFVSFKTATLETTLQREIVEPILTTASDFGKTGDALTLDVAVTFGSHLTVSCNPGDGSPAVVEELVDIYATSASLTHTFSTAGNYTIECTISNDVSTQAVTAAVVIQNPCVITTITPTKEVFFTTEAVAFDVAVQTPFPSSPFIKYDLLGDGAVLVPPAYMPTLETSGAVTLSHSAPVDGHPNGVHTIIATCNNMVDSQEAQVEYTVEEEITVLELIPNSLTTPPSFAATTTAVFTAKMATGYGVTLTFTPGDGTEDKTYVVDGSFADYTIEHTYATPGLITATLVATNLGSTMTVSVDIVVQPVLLPEALQLLFAGGALAGDASEPAASLVFDSIEEPKPTGLTLTIDLGDGSAPLTVENVDLPFTFDHTFTTGTYTVSITCTNLVTPEPGIIFESSVDISDQLSGMALSPHQPQAKLEEPFLIDVTFEAGSHINLTVDANDGTVFTVPYDAADPLKKSFVVSITYTQHSDYVVKVTAANHLGSLEKTLPVSMTAGVQGMLLALQNPNVSLPFGELTFFVVADPNAELPTSPSVTIDAGDGTVPTVYNNVDFSVTFEQIYTYTTPGTYTFSVIVANSAGSQTMVETVDVHEVITDVDFTFSSQETGEAKEAYAMEEVIQFVNSEGSGSSVAYTWLFVYGVPNVTTTDQAASYAFASPGVYPVALTAYNPVSSVSVVHEVKIASPIGVESFIMDRSIKYNEIVNFEIVFKEATAICITYTITEKNTGIQFDQFQRTSDPNQCKTPLPTDKQKQIAKSATDSFVYPYQEGDTFTPFQTIGEFDVNVHVEAPGGILTLNEQLAVSDIYCEGPEILRTKLDGLTIDNPRILARSEILSLAVMSEFVITKRCDLTQSMDLPAWHVYAVSQTGDRLAAIEPANIGMEIFVGEILIPPAGLAIGYYEINYVESVDSTIIEGKTGNASLFYQIVGSPLIAVLAYGEAQKVGHFTTFPLDAITESYDPDTDKDDKSEMVFKWYCWLDTPEEWAAIENMKQSPNPTLVEVPVGSKSTSEEVGPLYGCFGDGPGQLNIDQGKFSVDSGFMHVNNVYKVQAFIEKRERSSYTKVQSIEIVNGEPPRTELRIVGTKNLKTKLIHQQEVRFLATIECSICQPGVSADYKFTTTNTGTGAELDMSGKLVKTLIDGGVGCEFILLENVLEPGSTYIFQVEVTIPGLETGANQLTKEVNMGPTGGNCLVTPPIGEALSKFSLKCSGWTDDDEGPLTTIINYENEGVMNQIFSEAASLPQGPEANDFKLSLDFRITDSVGTYAQVIYAVKVRPPTGGEDAAFDKASGLLEEGDGLSNPQEFLSDVMAVTSLIPTNTGEDAGAGGGADTSSGGDAGNSGTNSGTSSGTDSGGTSGGGIISGGSGQVSRTQLARQKAAQEAEAKKQQEERQKKLLSNIVASVTNTLTAMATLDLKMTPAVTMNTAGTLAIIAKKFSGGNNPTAASDAMDSVMSVNSMIGNMKDPEQKKQVMGNLVDTVSGTLNGQNTEPIVEEPVDPDEEITEDLEERLKAEEEEKRRQEKESLQKTKSALNDLADSMKKNLLENTILNGPPVKIGTEKVSVTVAKATPDSLSGSSLNASTSSAIKMPSFKQAGTKGRSKRAIDDTEPLAVAITYTDDNVNSFGDGASDVTSGLVTPSIETVNSKETLEFEQLDDPLEVTLSGNDVPEDVNMTLAEVNEKTDMVNIYMGCKDPAAEVPSEDSNTEEAEPVRNAVIISLARGDTEADDMEYEVYIRLNATSVVDDQPHKPRTDEDGNTIQGYDIFEVFPNYTRPNPWILVIPEDVLYPCENGLYIGILPIKRDATTGSPIPATNNKTVPDVKIKTGLSRCRAWDEAQEKWTSGSCYVGLDSDLSNTRCKCTRLTNNVKTFAGGFTSPGINPINFNNIFSNFAALLSGNPTVFAVIFVLLGIYIAIGILVRHFDKKDLERWGVTPLIDNHPSQKVYYKISVYTGMRQNAGTRSRVSFIMSGDRGDTGVRVLDDGRGRNFSRGTLRHFVLSSDVDVGNLTFLRIWHDNSGPGSHGGWFLDKIIVENVHTNKKYFFLCSQWLAADEEDGLVDRILPVAGDEEVTGFQHLFFSKARRKFTEDHLWFSIVSRPTRSNFTRLQRLTCCVTLLFTTMIANAMFYKADENNENDRVLRIGPITISASTLLVSIYSSLIVIPPNTLIVTLFRKTKPKNWNDSEISEEQAEAMVEKAHDKQEKKKNKKEKKKKEDMTPEELAKKRAKKEKKKKAREEEAKKNKWWKKKYPLPYWCGYISWSVAIACILVSAMFVIFYSLEWGKVRSEEWLSALFLSTVQSIMVIQPVNVIFTAVVISLLFRTLDDDDEDEKANRGANATPDTDEELINSDPILASERIQSVEIPEPPSEEKLREAREKREYEKAMWNVIKEVGFYFLFLMLVSFIAWGSRDDLFFRFNESIIRLFESNIPKGSQVSDGHKFWKFMKNTAVPNLYNMERYNDRPTKRRERNFLSDMNNFRVGSVRLRQVRVVPDSCEMLPQLEEMLIECNEDYSLFTEEDRNFTAQWVLDMMNNETEVDRFNMSFKFQSTFDLRGIPYWGQMNTYGGGGYVADLGTTEGKASKMIDQLRMADWVDYYTRAVFLEFTVYNVNINLFAYVNYLFEFPAIGGIIPFPRVTSFQIYSGVGAFGAMLLACQILYCLILIYFIVHEAFKIKKEKKAYFKEPWNIFEWVLIGVSMGAIAVAVSKEGFGRMVMSSLSENKEAFTNYMALSSYDELYSYIVGVIIFMANIKFLRLLRFNQHIAHFAATLKHARVDLMYFGITFFIIFCAFGSWAHFLFGRTLLSFSSFVFTIETLYSMLIGKFDFQEMEQSDRQLGPIFFVCYCIVVFFIIVNMLLGILTIAYEEVKEQPHLMSEEYKVVDFILEKIKKALGIGKEPKRQFVQDDGQVINLDDIEYMDSVDILEKRLQSIDQLLTRQYRQMLGIDRPKNKTDMDDMDKKTKSLAIIERLKLGKKSTDS